MNLDSVTKSKPDVDGNEPATTRKQLNEPPLKTKKLENAKTISKETDNGQEQVMNAAAIGVAAKALIEEINVKRKRDADMLEEFKKALYAQVEKILHTVEQALYHTCQESSDYVQNKLQELFLVLGRLEAGELELSEFKERLEAFYKEFRK